MGKYVCDVCGTTYPDAAEQCPICGSANRDRVPTQAGGAGGNEAAAAAYSTKGGRFSRNNVRKRNIASGTAQPKRNEQPQEDEQNNAGLVAVVVLLLLAIVAVLIYIGVRYFTPSDVPEDTGNSSVVETTDPTDDPTEDPNRIACESIALSNPSIKLSVAGETFRLVVQRQPSNTTDALTFTSSDESVATVTNDGLVTAVSGGNAIITAKCGDQTATCVVSCPFETDSTDPSDPSGTEFVWNFEWNTYFQLLGKADVTLFYRGETWRAYNLDMNVSVGDVTWHSDNEDVCTFVNGIVTAVGAGDAYIYAEYNGVRYTGIVRCLDIVEGDTTDPSEDTTEPGGDNTEPGGDTTEPGGDTTEPGGDTTEPGGGGA